MRPVKWLRLTAGVFRADVEDLIQWKWIVLGVNGALENVGEVRRQGVEGSITADFACGLKMLLGAEYVDVENEVTGEKIKNIPRLTVNTHLSYNSKKMSHSLI